MAGQIPGKLIDCKPDDKAKGVLAMVDEILGPHQ
jgi:hypothetical protein